MMRLLERVQLVVTDVAPGHPNEILIATTHRQEREQPRLTEVVGRQYALLWAEAASLSQKHVTALRAQHHRQHMALLAIEIGPAT